MLPDLPEPEPRTVLRPAAPPEKPGTPSVGQSPAPEPEALADSGTDDALDLMDLLEEAAMEEVDPEDPEITTKEIVILPNSESPRITIDQAVQRIGPNVLKTLEEKFNGSLVEVRSPDERDYLF